MRMRSLPEGSIEPRHSAIKVRRRLDARFGAGLVTREEGQQCFNETAVVRKGDLLNSIGNVDPAIHEGAAEDAVPNDESTVIQGPVVVCDCHVEFWTGIARGEVHALVFEHQVHVKVLEREEGDSISCSLTEFKRSAAHNTTQLKSSGCCNFQI